MSTTLLWLAIDGRIPSVEKHKEHRQSIIFPHRNSNGICIIITTTHIQIGSAKSISRINNNSTFKLEQQVISLLPQNIHWVIVYYLLWWQRKKMLALCLILSKTYIGDSGVSPSHFSLPTATLTSLPSLPSFIPWYLHFNQNKIKST